MSPVLAPQSLANSLFPATLIRESFIGATPAGDSCVGVTPGAGTGVLRTTDCNGWDYWAIPQFTSSGHPGSLGSGGPQIVASGMGTTDAAASYAAIGRRLFANTVYHCGPGRLAYTVCATDGSVVPEGPWTLVQVALGEAVTWNPPRISPWVSASTWTGTPRQATPSEIGESGGVEVEYQITGNTDGIWTLSRSDGAATTARRLLADNSITLVISSSELGAATGYRTYAMEGANGTALPAVGQRRLLRLSTHSRLSRSSRKVARRQRQPWQR